MFYSRQKEECYEIVYRKCSSICAGINNAYTDDIKCAKQNENLGKPTRLNRFFSQTQREPYMTYTNKGLPKMFTHPTHPMGQNHYYLIC